jgi:hypothetical protein
MNKIRNSTFYVKLTHWEYWNFYVVYAFVILYYIYLAIKSRTLLFFTASNPGIENSGFIGESKSEIFRKIPSEYLPPYIFIKPKETISFVLDKLKEHEISFPFIAKPDVGERGQGISKINDLDALRYYHTHIHVPYIIQAFVDYELELGVFYYRFPNQSKGVISSIVRKGFLTVTGDGKSTLKQLIENYPRARFRLSYLENKFAYRINAIVPKGETIELEGIGNHSRGTTFLNANQLINDQLRHVFDGISKRIDGFYFGRFDLRCKSIEDLCRGENIRILELNGAGAEPAHIYQPGFSFWEGQKVLLYHWKVLYQISEINIRNGIKPLNFQQARSEMRKHAQALKSIGI